MKEILYMIAPCLSFFSLGFSLGNLIGISIHRSYGRTIDLLRKENLKLKRMIESEVQTDDR